MTAGDAFTRLAEASAPESSFTMMAAVQRFEQCAIDFDEVVMDTKASALERLRRRVAVSDRVTDKRAWTPPLDATVCSFSPGPKTSPPLSVADPPSSSLIDMVFSFPCDSTILCM